MLVISHDDVDFGMLTVIVLTMMMMRTVLCWQVDTGADQQQEADSWYVNIVGHQWSW